MNNRYERDNWRDNWQRDDRERQDRRGGTSDDPRNYDEHRYERRSSDDDRRYAGSRDDRDHWPNRVEGRDRNRWDERDERSSHAEHTFDQYGQQYGQPGQRAQYAQDYRGGEQRYGSQRDYRNQNQDYRSGQGYGQDYRFTQGSGQEYRGQEHRAREPHGEYHPENRWSSESRWGSENRPHGQVPYAGSGEPRWGEPSRYGSSQYGGAYDANRFGRGNYGTYGTSYGQGSDWSRNRQEGASFFGRGPKGYTRSDDRIREDVCDRLSYDDEVDASDVTVTVQGGEVTLEGTVPDRHSKHRAEDIADNVNGVRDVHNRLKARRGFFQEVGDKLMGREEEQEQGHAGSGTRNSPSGISGTSGTSRTGSASATGTTSSTSQSTFGTAATPNGRG